MSAAALEEMRDFAPEWGLVLGSGLGGGEEQIQICGRAPFAAFEGMAASRVKGHAGEFLWGRLGSARLLVASGRVHLYEGHSAQEVTAAVRVMGETGLRRLLLTNAAGTLNPAHPPGAWMMITDHLNLTGTSPLIGGSNFTAMNGLYSTALRARFAAAAMAEATSLSSGVYAGVVGPQYETPAEVRMLRLLGADAVGMSTVLEAIQAQALGLEVAAFSCLTNWAAGLSDETLSHEAVLAKGREAAAAFWRLLRRFLADYASGSS